MKKHYFTIVLFLVCFYVYAQEMPLSKIAPHKVAYFQEITGRANINNETLTYWLYQCSPNDIEELISYLHSYVESIGYIVDYNSFSGIYENPNLAMSVRSLMVWRRRNVSVTINNNNALVINIETEEEGSLENRTYYFLGWSLIGR